VPTLNTRPRLQTLAQKLNQSPFDLVCLQEVQWNPYTTLLRDQCHAFPHYASEPFLYAPKGGLLTLSRWPITRQQFVMYDARPIRDPLMLMDWALHKGILLSELAIDGFPVVVLNTHLNANYSANWQPDSYYTQVEQQQLTQLAALVRAQPTNALVIACGDFNIPRGSSLYSTFLAASGMLDPLAGDQRPTLRLPPGLPDHLANPLDFALVRLPNQATLAVHSELMFTMPLVLANGRCDYLSDHYGVALDVG
jgi:endonuclease/exonuclease/phosphatase family metal-dependent hydrolase